jgi:acetylornithine deacetylase
VTHAGLFLAETARWDREVLPERTHPLLGRGSAHAGRIEGGTGFSVYPARCTLQIERRTIPGETTDGVMDTLRGMADELRQRHAHFDVNFTIRHAQPPSDVPADAPVVQALSAALASAGKPVKIEGFSAWTDAALLNSVGIPAIVFGPGDLSLAHAAEEYISLDQVEQATVVLAEMARRVLAGS